MSPGIGGKGEGGVSKPIKWKKVGDTRVLVVNRTFRLVGDRLGG